MHLEFPDFSRNNHVQRAKSSIIVILSEILQSLRSFRMTRARVHGDS